MVSLVMGMHSGAVFSSWYTWKSIQLQGSQELGVLGDFVRYSEVLEEIPYSEVHLCGSRGVNSQKLYS